MEYKLPLEIFIDDASDFICSICREVAHPLVTTTCGHPFCEKCMCRWLVMENVCPDCRALFPNPKKPELFAQRIYNKMKVRCLHSSKGCKYEGHLKEMLETHIEKECEFAIVPCFYEGCFANIERRYLQSHLSQCTNGWSAQIIDIERSMEPYRSRSRSPSRRSIERYRRRSRSIERFRRNRDRSMERYRRYRNRNRSIEPYSRSRSRYDHYY